MTDTADSRPWRRFILGFTCMALALAAVFYACVVALDPYGLRTGRGSDPGPIMDLNQRFMYPQIVRSGRFDSAVFGTSTVRLLDPEKLNAAFGGRFANLGLNAGTPWEQMQLADLFLRTVPEPRAMIFGLDLTWCEPDADEKKLTFRPFPPWLYDEDRLNDYPQLLNLTSLEIAGRMALNRLGLMSERIRPDGYEVFVPDEALYDLERAQAHIWGNERRPPLPPLRTVELSSAEKRQLRFPALTWLDAALGRVPASAEVVLTMMPIHYAAQPWPGSRESAVDAECKARIAQLGRARGATVVDFRILSDVTFEDSNYWDPLHYRIGIAERIVAALREARLTGRDAADGFYRVLNPATR